MNRKISEILKKATDNESNARGFYEGLQYNGINEESLTLLFKKNPSHRNQMNYRFRKFGKVAAILAAIFVVSSGMLLSLNDGGIVSGVKGKIGQKVTKDNMDMVNIQNEGISSVDDKKVKEVQITDWSKVEKAQNILPELYIPHYIPDRYQFQKLNIQNDSRGIYTADYNYKSTEGQELVITQYKKINDNLTIGNSEIVTLPDGKKVYIAEGNLEDTIIASYMNETDKFDFVGALTTEELQQIIIGLNK